MSTSQHAQQYGDASNLDAHIALHARFSRSTAAWFPWVFDRLTLLWRENLARVPQSWHITLTDLSPGMIGEAKAQLQNASHAFTFAVADAEKLPFDDGDFDAVIANHMLYHVPDLSRALSEVRRVLKPGGRLFAATNGEAHMRELDNLSDNVVAGGVVSAFARSDHLTNFTLETAPGHLQPYFPEVTLHRPEGDPDLYVTEAEPLVAYILSVTPQEVRQDEEKVSALRRRVAQALADAGEVRITRATGLFEARAAIG